ncbi:hypothetical protein TNCV_5084011 [Trichonephila clavipes]|nr:hypothetical protein TNCV_5084011 [Trichonephila clavipes]
MGYRKVSTRYMPKPLILDHKSKRMGFRLYYLMWYVEEGNEFFCSELSMHHLQLRLLPPRNKSSRCVTSYSKTTYLQSDLIVMSTKTEVDLFGGNHLMPFDFYDILKRHQSYL